MLEVKLNKTYIGHIVGTWYTLPHNKQVWLKLHEWLYQNLVLKRVLKRVSIFIKIFSITFNYAVLRSVWLKFCLNCTLIMRHCFRINFYFNISTYFFFNIFFSADFLKKLLLDKQVKLLICRIFIHQSLEQTTHVSSLPSTYGGHFREPHRASTR